MSSSPQKEQRTIEKPVVNEAPTENESDIATAIAAAQEPNLRIDRNLIPSVPLQEALSGSTKQELDILAQLGVQTFNTSEVEQNVLQQVDAAFEKQEQLNEQLLKNVRQKKQAIIARIRQIGKPTTSQLKQQITDLQRNVDELRSQENALIKKLNQFRQQRVIEDAGFEEALLHKEQAVPTRRLIPLPVNNNNTNNSATVNNNTNNNTNQADNVNKYLAEISKRNAARKQANNNVNTNETQIKQETTIKEEDIKDENNNTNQTKQAKTNKKKTKRATKPRAKRRKKNDGDSDDDYDSIADSDAEDEPVEQVDENDNDEDEEIEESDESSTSKSRKRKRSSLAAWQDDSNEDFFSERIKTAKSMKTLLREDEVTELSPGYQLANRVFNNLFEHQLIGVRWLWELHQQACGGIIADEMGLGKTITTIGYLSALLSSGVFELDNYKKKKMVLIVCPATVMQQWVSEFHHWAPDFRIVLFHRLGVTSVKKSQRHNAASKLPLGEQFAGLFNKYVAPISPKDTAPLVVITSYESVRIYSEVILAFEWSYVIMDEGHKLRNPNANITIACKQFLTPHRIILTGAPIQNNLVELWSLFDFIFPGKLGTLPMFQRQFSDPITRGGYASATKLQRQLALKCAIVLRDLIKPYLLRRLKSDVNLMLPQKTEQVLFCKLTEFQREEYLKFLGSREGQAVIKGLKNPLYGMDVLRKICNHPDLLLLLEAKKAKYGIEDDDEESNMSKARKYGRRNVRAKKVETYSYKYEHTLDDSPAVVDGEPENNVDNNDDENIEGEDENTRLQVTRSHIERSAKLQVLKQVLKLWSQQGHKVLLFSQTRQMLDIIEAFVNEEGYTYNRMDGTTPIGTRQSLISQFNDPESGLFVFLLTTKVGGLGVNLTGANRVILFDPDWNPSTDLQARERSYRIGQNRDVVVFRLITSGTIEEKIYHRQIFKQFLTNRILRKHQGNATGANAFFKSKDLRELFSLDDKHEENETSRIFGEHLDADAMTGVTKTESIANTSSANNNNNDSAAMQVDEGSAGEKTEKSEHEEQINNDEGSSDDDWLLKGLVGKALQGAVDHDAIIGLEGENEHRPKPKKKSSGRKIDRDHEIWNEMDDTMQQLTTEYARRAAEQLRLEREELRKLPINKPTWTGKRGFALDNKPRFGRVSSAVTPVKNDASAGAGFSQSDTGLTSSNVLAELKAKNPVVNIREKNKPREDHVRLVADIREFMVEQGGSATSKDLVDKFKQRVTGNTMEVFKNLLKQVADLNKAEKAWYLKEEFK